LTQTANPVQNYKVWTSPSPCYEFDHDSITFTIDGVAAIIPNDWVKQSQFQFRTSQNDLDVTSHNSVRFVFTTEYTQIYIYAALVCKHLEFPTDQDMKDWKVV